MNKPERIRAEAADGKEHLRRMSTAARIERGRIEPPPSPMFQGDIKSHWVYVFRGGGYVKVGIALNVDARLKSVRHSVPFEMERCHTLAVPKYLVGWVERKIMADLSSAHVRGEWFICDPDWAVTCMEKRVKEARRHDRERIRSERRRA